MAFGMEIKTPLGARVMDHDDPVMYVRDSGASIILADALAETVPIPTAPVFYGSVLAADGRTHYAGNASTTETMFNSTFKCPTPLWDADDLAFFQIPTEGIFWGLGLEIPWNNINGTVFAVCSQAPGNINWKVASKTTGAPVGDYGMQVLKAGVDVKFDSRHETIGITDSFVVPQADIADILDNDASYDLTLGSNVPDAYVSLPWFASFDADSHSGLPYRKTRFVKVTQTADNKLTLTREEFSSTTQHARRPYSGQYFGLIQDTIILVSR